MSNKTEFHSQLDLPLANDLAPGQDAAGQF
jgi:hypothetical protein